MADDPFFADEDGDDFDDLYRRPAPAASPRRDERRAAVDDDAQSLAPAGRPSDGSLATPASRVASAKRERVASRSEQPRAREASSVKKDRKVRRKGSQELFDVDWDDEARVSACTICASGFSLVRRKHHCRPCGRVMCSECSSFLFFESSQRKHRVCAACASDHAAAVGKARKSQKDSNFDLAGSDAESSGVMHTPTSVASDKRGGFRASVLHAITPSSAKRDKKKAKKGFGTGSSQKAQVTIAQPRQVANGTTTIESREQRTSASLFNNAEDAWFTEPKDDDDDGCMATRPSTASRPEAGFQSSNFSDGFADSTGSHSAVEEWRDKVKASYQLQLETAPASRVAPASGFGFNRNGFSEQFNYDGDDDDDKSADDDFGSGGRASMPRPAPVEPRILDQPSSKADTPVSRQPSSTANTPVSRPSRNEPDQLRQSTLKVNIKGLFHGKSKKDKREKQQKNKDAPTEEVQVSPVAVPDRNTFAASFFTPNSRMTLDELEVAPKPIPVVAPPTRPTFYDDDADELVVDDTPGFFEESMAEKLAKKKKEEELQRRMAEDAAWVNSIAVPASSNNRFSSGQESFSIVDAPSHGASSPESASNVPQSESTSQPSSNAKEHGLTGALKRFFGMSSAKTPDKAPAPPSSDKAKVSQNVDQPKESQQVSPAIARRESLGPRKSVPEGYMGEPAASASTTRYSMGDSGDYVMPRPQERADTLRNTMAATVDASASLRPNTFMVPETTKMSPKSKRKKSSKSLKRRDTFDDLFESPKAVDRHNAVSFADVNLPNRSWNTVDVPTSAQYSVGVSRFDARRDEEEDDLDFLNDNGAPNEDEVSTSSGLSHEFRSSTQQHVVGSRRDSDVEFDSPKRQNGGFTWSNVKSAPGFGTATYAVPAGVQMRDSRFGGDRFATHDHDEDDEEHRNTSHNIMQDLHNHSSSANRKKSTSDSVDDIFAQFDRPNDYIFDPATGSYIPARQPPRSSRQRESTQEPSQHQEVARTSSFGRQSSNRIPEDQRPRSSIGRQTRDAPRYEQQYVFEASTLVEQRVYDQSGNGSESNESDADVIVDKISSLEGELAALKRLIKNRKGGNPKHSQSDRRKSSAPVHESNKPRKESIFDGDSDSDNEAPKSKWGVVSSSNRLDKGVVSYDKAKFKQPKKRRDSFASLFDDEAEKETSLAGNGGYEALFEGGATKSEGSEEDESASKIAKKRRSKKRSKKKLPEVATSPEPDNLQYAVVAEEEDEEEFESLKNKRSVARQRRRSSKDRATPKWAEDSPDEAPTSVVTSNSKKAKNQDVVPVTKTPTKKQNDADSIDALFDTSSDADMANLYGAETTLDVNTSETKASKEDDEVVSSSHLASQHLSDSSEDDSSDKKLTASLISSEKDLATQSAEVTFALPPSLSSTIATSGGDTSDSDEDFAINWKKVKTSRNRRKTRPSIGQPASFVPVTRSGLFDDDDDEPPTAHPSDLADNASNKPGGDEELEAAEPELLPVQQPANPSSMNDIDVLTADEVVSSDDELHLSKDGKHNDAVTLLKSDPVDHDDNSTSLVATRSSPPSLDNEEDVPMPQNSFVSRIERVDTSKSLHKDADLELFDNSKDVDIHALMGGSAIDELDVTASTESSKPEDSDEGENGSDADDGGFSFEVRPTRRKTPPPLDMSPVRRPSSTASVLSQDSSVDSFVLGRYSRAPPSRAESALYVDDGLETIPADNFSRSDSVSNESDALSSVAGDELLSPAPENASAFNADWQAMQEQEKERKKKLQMKQRQAQRDKLKKQHSKAVVSSTSAQEGKSKKPKKKKKADETGRKHRHRDKDKRAEAPDEDTRSLTEL